jgi:hypothetical protein
MFVSLVWRETAWYHHVVSNIWTPEKIENYKSASEYTSFHRKLSVLAEPYLDERWTLADIGCGPGLIDYWLASMVVNIDAIDNDPVAIEYLTKSLDDAYIMNRSAAEKIKPRLATVDELGGESWDVVMACFFGANEETLEKILPLARRRILIFMHGRPDASGPLAACDDGGKFSAVEMESYLDKKGFVFKKNVMEMQFGQPFKTIEDIHAFLSAYGDESKESVEGEVSEGDNERKELSSCGKSVDESVKRMTDAEERIVKTNRFDYPYYLPKSISVALFIVVVKG